MRNLRAPAVFRLLLLLGLAALPAAALTPEEEAAYIRSHYAKFEHRIPMRDGARLFTSVYLPNDTGAGRTYPILLTRTPYGVDPYGADRYRERLGPAAAYAEEGFIFVYQDVRGRYMSEGEFVDMRPHRAEKGAGETDESTDTYDTIEWLLAHLPGHNGKVGLWGISYPGFYAAAGMIDSHPALAAVSPQAVIADWFWDDMHHHGAFTLALAFRFFASFGRVREGLTTEDVEPFDFATPDAYRFYLDLGPLANANARYFQGEIPFWNRFVEHPNYDGFWQKRNLLPHLDGIRAAVLVVGGWFDAEDLYGPLHVYRRVEEANPGIFNSLVMGPWPHGGWTRTEGDRLGSAEFGFKTSDFYVEEVELPFFRHFLKGEGKLTLPEALVFETGANRWRRFDAWPPPGLEERTLYLREGGGLSWEAPAGGAPGGDAPGGDAPAGDAPTGDASTGDAPTGGTAEGFDAFVSDPAKPVPYTQQITNRWAREYMTEDQRFAARRPDVLVYQSAPLEEDLTLAGPVEVELAVATTGTDADWVVKLIDVFPGQVPGWEEESGEPDPGHRQTLVRGEIFRGRFRDGYEEPRPFVPGEVTRVAFPLQDLFHTFKRGHRLMVQVQSTWFPLFDRNPQTFVPNIFAAAEEDFRPATHRVYRSPQHPSRLRVGVLGTGD